MRKSADRTQAEIPESVNGPDETAWRLLVCGTGSGAAALAARLADRLGDRAFIDVADPPLDTAGLAAAALEADAAVLVVDASGDGAALEPQFLLSAFGPPALVLAVDGMDRVGHDASVFEQIVSDYRRQLSVVEAVPISESGKDNVEEDSPSTPWYSGPSLIDALRKLAGAAEGRAAPLRMAVRPDSSGGWAGRVLAGTARTGARVRALPSGAVAEIGGIRTGRGHWVREAAGPEPVVVTLAESIEAGGPLVLTAAEEPCGVADQFETVLVWTSSKPMVSGRQYTFRIAGVEALGTPSRPKHRIDPATREPLAAKTLDRGQIGRCNIALDRAVAFEPFRSSRSLGRFLLLDRSTGERVALGRIEFALRRATNVHPQALDVDRAARSAIKGHRPCVLWFTGLSSSGKSTISNIVECRLNARGYHTILLDGDNVRHGLNRDLGFTEADRAENIRRIAEVSKLMTDAGLITLVSFISPFAAERQTARELIGGDQFFEIFVDAPLAVAEARDPKGLYKKAREGKIQNFTGIGSPYEPPESPDLHLETARISAEESAARVIRLLEDRGLLA